MQAGRKVFWRQIILAPYVNSINVGRDFYSGLGCKGANQGRSYILSANRSVFCKDCSDKLVILCCSFFHQMVNERIETFLSGIVFLFCLNIIASFDGMMRGW